MPTTAIKNFMLGVLAAPALASCQPSPQGTQAPSADTNIPEPQPSWRTTPLGPYGMALDAGALDIVMKLGNVEVPVGGARPTKPQAEALADALQHPENFENFEVVVRPHDKALEECHVPLTSRGTSQGMRTALELARDAQFMAAFCDAIKAAQAPSQALSDGPYSQALIAHDLKAVITLGARRIDMADITQSDMDFLERALEHPKRYREFELVVTSKKGDLNECAATATTDGTTQGLADALAAAHDLPSIAAQCDARLARELEEMMPEVQAAPAIDPHTIAMRNPYPDIKVTARFHLGPLADEHQVGRA